MTTQADDSTISLAAAADQLGTNSLVIRRWVDEGHIRSVLGSGGELQILQAPFEAQCEAIQKWLRGFNDATEEGYTNASVQEMEEFWKLRR